MKRFFSVSVLILSVAFLAGCSSSRGDGRRTAPDQPYGIQSNRDTKRDISRDNAIQETAYPGKTIPQGQNLSETVPYAQNRIVAENVRIGKENIGGLTEAMLAEKLAAAAAKMDVPAVDATIDSATWQVKYGKQGKRLDTGKMTDMALRAEKTTIIPYSWQTVQPNITSSQIRSRIKQIAKCTTPFLDRSRSRIKNIRLASSKLNRTIVQPGQEFSFNAVTGSKSAKYGYQKATVIVKTSKGPVHKKAVGGGVCQISTTLFNAVQQCGLKVTERHEHSDDVYYVPDGKDATVTYGGADFRFINSRHNPVMIKVYVGKRSLQVSIYEYTGR